MASENQQTVASPVEFSGIGVHSGEESRLTIKPGPVGSGLVFRRVDLEGSPSVPARLEHVVETELGTTLGVDDVRVRTVEHVLAALAGRGVDNAVLDLDGLEPPILDGSFEGYASAIGEAGLSDQGEPAEVLRLSQPLEAKGAQGATYVAVPDDAFRISATIDFEHPRIGRQYGAFRIEPSRFLEELAPARTFGFRADAETLQAKGLALGASLENTIVIDGDDVMNGGLRFPDEFLRHKVGDLVGDLALLGGRFRGHVIAERPSHNGNVSLARAIGEHHDRVKHSHVIDVRRIMEHLPHRYPMLLVDRILEFESGKRIVGLKNVTINEPFFVGHFPDHPVMPGVLIIEAMGQVGGLLLMDLVEDPEGKIVLFMAVDKVKWRRPVLPGDQVIFELELLQFRRNVCKMRGTGTVDGKIVAEAELMAGIVDR